MKLWNCMPSCPLWSAMNEPNYVYCQEDDDRMALADTALRRLNTKKREMLNMNSGGSPFPSAAYQPSRPLVRQNAFQFPSGDGGGSQQQSQSLNDDSVAKLLSVLAKGQSKLATPSCSGMHGQILFLKSNRLRVCYWIFSSVRGVLIS
jgi:hypothetical protein